MTDVMEQEAPTAEVTKTRKHTPLTDVEKQAATLRRDATLLAKYGNQAKADELYAQANQLSPEKPAQGTRVDPLAVLTAEEQAHLRKHFQCSKEGFVNIAAVISAKKLQEIAAQG